MANPAAALAQRDAQGGSVDPKMMMLVFLAGMGMPTFASTMEKMRPKPPSHHKGGGMAADAAGAPGMAIPPQLAAMLAQRAVTPGMPGPGLPPGLPPGMVSK